MASAVKTRVSEEEYLATMTGEKPSLEFVNGAVFQKPMTRKDHNEIARVLNRRFIRYEEEQRGYWTWESTTNLSRADDRRYRVPDMAYYAPGRPVAQPDDIFLPATLAIEVRSRTQSRTALRQKCREYRDRGVDVCWLIDPEQRWVEVFDEGRDGERLLDDGVLESGLLPGFSLPIADLWAALE